MPKPVKKDRFMRAGNAFSMGGEADFAFVEAEAGQPAKRPTFKIRAYNGDALVVGDYYYPVVVDLSGLEAANSVPILLDHDPQAIVGQANEVKIAAKSIDLSGVITGEDDYSQKVITHAKNGFKWGASIGVMPSKVERVENGATAQANGKTFKGPINIVRAGRLRETSILSIGADHTATTTIAARAAGDTAMTFEEWLKENGFDDAKLSAKQRKFLTAQHADWLKAQEGEGGDTDGNGGGEGGGSNVTATAPAVTATVPDTVKAARAATAAELRRTTKIVEICGNKNGEIAAKAIEEGWTVEATELAVLKASRPNVAPITSPTVNAENGKAIEASILMSAGLGEKYLAKHYDDKTMNAAMSKEIRGASISTLLFQTIRAAGLHVREGRVNNDVVQAAGEAIRILRASGGFSTISLPNILSNVANKAMLERFDLAESVALQIADTTDTNDFKQFSRYRLDSTGSLNQVGQNGELKHIPLSESTYTNQLATYGGMIALTRQMMINDDLGAFLQIPQIFGELAKLAIEETVFTKILANTGSFFSTGNSNYFEGLTTNLSLASLGTALQKFREQKNAGGKFMLITPSILLVPPALESVARSIFSSQFVNETTTANSKSPSKNIYENMFKPLVSPYLGSAAALTNYSDTAWYLLAAPRPGVSIAQVGFLAGQRAPVIESAESDFNTLGMQWRAYLDFGCSLLEKRAGVMSKGAA